MVNDQRLATLMQVVHATEDNVDAEAYRAFCVYCEQYYLPEEIATVRHKALVDKLVGLARGGQDTAAVKRCHDFLRKFEYAREEYVVAEKQCQEILRIEAAYAQQPEPQSLTASNKSAIVPRPTTDLTRTSLDADDLDLDAVGRAIAETLSSLEARCRFAHVHSTTGGRVIQFRFVPDKGVTVQRFANKGRDLQVAHSLPKLPAIFCVPGFVVVEFLRSNCDPPRLDDYVRKLDRGSKSAPLQLRYGVDVEGNDVALDLRDSSAPHTLLVTSGHGDKIDVLLGLIASGSIENAPDSLLYLLIDPERTNFFDFDQSPHLWRGTEDQFDAIQERAEAALQNLCVEAKRRETLCLEARCKDIEEYNEKCDSLPRIVVVMSEVGLVKDEFKSFDHWLAHWAEPFARYGINLIAGCGRYIKRALSPTVRRHLSNRIVMSRSLEDSKAALGSDLAVSLDEKGDGYFQQGENSDTAVRFSSFCMDKQSIDWATDWCRTRYPQQRRLAPTPLAAELSDLFAEFNTSEASEASTVLEDLWDAQPAIDDDYATWLKIQSKLQEVPDASHSSLVMAAHGVKGGTRFDKCSADVKRLLKKYAGVTG